MTNLEIKKIKFRPINLLEQVTSAISDAILDGVFKGGERLVETELQRQFQVSRSPIRESFINLEKKGLIEIIPRKGVFVKKLTYNNI